MWGPKTEEDMEIRPELLLPVAIAVGVLFEKLGDLRAARRAQLRSSNAPVRLEGAGARGEAGYERKAA